WHSCDLQLPEVVGVSLELQLPRRRLVNDGVDAVLFGVGHCRFLAWELQLELTPRIATAGPAHQRIGLARLRRDEVEDPLVGQRLAGLSRILRAFYDSGLFDIAFRSELRRNQDVSNAFLELRLGTSVQGSFGHGCFG